MTKSANMAHSINKFSFRRVMHLVKYEAKGYIWWLIGITLFTLFMTFPLISFSLLENTNTSSMDYSYLFPLIFSSGCFPMVICMNVFLPINKKFTNFFDLIKKNDDYFILPASQLEKYFSKLFGIFIIGGTTLFIAAIIMFYITSLFTEFVGFINYFLAYKEMVITVYSVFSFVLLSIIYEYDFKKRNTCKAMKATNMILELLLFFPFMYILFKPFIPENVMESWYLIPFFQSFVSWIDSLGNVVSISRSIVIISSPIALIIGYNMWKNLEGIGGRYD